MTASRLGLAALVAIAIGLAAFVIGERPRAPVVADRALLPGVDADTITELAWTLADGTQVSVVRTGPGAPWRFRESSDRAAARVEEARLDAALAALRGGRWQRTVGRKAPLVAPTTQVVVTAGARSVTFGVAPAGAGQTWIVRDGEALLVDDWLARALAPTVLELRQRRPLADIESAISFHVKVGEPADHFSIERHTLFFRDGEEFRIDRELLTELERAMAELEFVSLPTNPGRGPEMLAVRAILAEPVTVHVQAACTGPSCACPAGTHVVRSDIGDGCVPRAQVDALVGLATRFRGPATELADPRCISVEPAAYYWGLGGSQKLTFDKQPMVQSWGSTGPADIERAVAIAAAMKVPGRVVPFTPTGKGERRSVITDAGMDQSFELYPGNLVHRVGEPVAIELPPAAHATLSWTLDQVRDKRLWIEEPTAIQTITLREIQVKPGRSLHTRILARGAVVGEWLADGQSLARDQGTKLDAFVAKLAALRARGIIPKPEDLQYQILLEVNPFPGSATEPTVHNLRLAAPTADGCPATSDALPGSLLEPEICEVVAELLAH